MSRDNSSLYTGSTSASFGSTKESQISENNKRLLKDRREEAKNVLKPSAEIIFSDIDTEIKMVTSIQNIDMSNVPDERLFMAEMMARQRYIFYLKQLKTRLSITLRESPVKESEEDE